MQSRAQKELEYLLHNHSLALRAWDESLKDRRQAVYQIQQKEHQVNNTAKHMEQFVAELIARVRTETLLEVEAGMPGAYKFPKRPIHSDLADLSRMILEDATKNGSNQYRDAMLAHLRALRDIKS